jgi:hypothetical protein
MRNNSIYLVLIVILAFVAVYIVWPTEHPFWLEQFVARGGQESRDLRNLKLGLDLQGGSVAGSRSA